MKEEPHKSMLNKQNHENLWWIVGAATYGVGDIATTGAGLAYDSITEGNALGALVFNEVGLTGLLALKILSLVLLYSLSRISPHTWRVGVPIGLSILGIFATTWNLYIISAVL